MIRLGDDRAAALVCYYKYIEDAHPKHDPLKDWNFGGRASFLLAINCFVPQPVFVCPLRQYQLDALWVQGWCSCECRSQVFACIR